MPISSFRAGAREGFRSFLPMSVGLIPWAMVTGMAMISLWQAFALVGVLAAGSIPKHWSLEFMATIALLVLLVPMAKQRPMLVAAVSSGATAVLLRGMPLRLGLIVAIVVGIGAGFAAEHWHKKGDAA